MTREDVDILFSEPVRRAIEDNLSGDPLRVALDSRIPHASLVATQVKYLQRARTKLPSYYAACCVIPPLAFEQSSSELTASHKGYSGSLCVDMTCGLGVDSLAFSGRFREVITIERDPALAYLAQRNFGLLGAQNIRVVNMAAEDFIASNPTLKADLIYADPDRRSDSGRKLVRLEECAPDVTEMLPRLRGMTGRIAVKLSPLFDVDEAFRVFGDGTRVEVVSLDGECKEVIAETGPDVSGHTIAATVIGFGTVEYSRDEPHTPAVVPSPEGFRFLVIPDVALAKARIAAQYFTDAGFSIESDISYAFGNALPGKIPGRAYIITAAYPYSPKKLKKVLKEAGISRADILKHDFPLPAEDIARQLGIAQGGAEKIAFTRGGGALWAIFIEET